MKMAYFYLLLCVSFCFCFPMPGMHPVDYLVGDAVEIRMSEMTSIHTQIPYKYYDMGAVCTPTGSLDIDALLKQFGRGGS